MSQSLPHNPYTIEVAKNHLKGLLELMGIDKVYFVDDSLSKLPDLDELVGLVNSIYSSGFLNKLNIEKLVIEFNEDVEIYTDNIKEKWGELSALEQIKYFEICYGILGRKKEFTDINISTALKDYFFDNVLVLCTPTEWQGYINTFNNQYKILALFDQNLTKEGGIFTTKKGQDLILEVKQKGFRKSIFPALFTYTIQKLDEEIDERERIINEILENGDDISSEDFFVFTKERLNKANLFIDSIKKLFLNEHSEKIKNATISILGKAFEKTVKELKTIDTYSFDLAVLKSSLIEGVWEAETLLRIINIYFEDFIKTEMLSSNYLLTTNESFSVAHSVSKSCEIPLEGAIESPYLNPIKLRQKEIYELGENINGLFKPIENGDIFELIDSNYKKHLYILVAQECDLMLRTNGKRKLETGVLLYISKSTFQKIEKEEKMAFESAKKKQQSHVFWDTRYKLGYFDNNNIGIVKFTHDPLIVDLNFLDIVSFNTSGEIITQIDENINKLTSSSLKLRELLVKKSITLKIMEINKILKNFPRNSEVYKNIYSKLTPELVIVGNIKVSAQIKYEINSNSVYMSVKRIKRLRQPYSRLLLEKYMQYLTRNAELHDFAKGE